MKVSIVSPHLGVNKDDIANAIRAANVSPSVLSVEEHPGKFNKSCKEYSTEFGIPLQEASAALSSSTVERLVGECELVILIWDGSSVKVKTAYNMARVFNKPFFVYPMEEEDD